MRSYGVTESPDTGIIGEKNVYICCGTRLRPPTAGIGCSTPTALIAGQAVIERGWMHVLAIDWLRDVRLS